MPTVADLCDYLESFAPRTLAESWDNVGLLVGNRGATLTRIMTCLTVTPQTAREAIEHRAELIVTHHPVLFRPVQRLTADDRQGRMLLELIRAGVSIYSPHTSFDSTAGGINELLASRLGLDGIKPLRPAKSSPTVKLVVFVPAGDLEEVSRAMFDAGAGVIGEYRDCSFRVAGTGSFFGSEASHPTVGQASRREEVEEFRLEVLCPRARLDGVLEAMRRAHSYEEPAIDIYPLADVATSAGSGRFGTLATPINLESLALHVKSTLESPLVQVVGPRWMLVRRVAVGCGSGGDFHAEAAAAECDVLVTGEASFHRQLEAEDSKTALVLAGHFATERFAVVHLAEKLAREFPSLDVSACQSELDPAWLV